MAESKVKWVILGSVIGTIVTVAISPLIKHLFKQFYEKVGINVGGPRRMITRRR